MVAPCRPEPSSCRVTAAATCIAAFVVLPAAARAQAWSDPWGGSWSGAAGLVSDKVFRGVSQTRGHATALLDLNRRSDTGWTFGLGIAPLRTGGGDAEQTSRAEVVASLGRSWQLDADWAAQLGFAHYAYPGRGSRSPDYAYDEWSATLGWRGRMFVTLAASPHVRGGYSAYGSYSVRSAHAASAEWSLRQTLAPRLALDAGIGYYDLSAVRGAGYRYGSIGLSWTQGPLQLYLTRIASNAAARGLADADIARARWVGSVLWNF